MSSTATLLGYSCKTDYIASTEEYGKKLVNAIAFIEMESASSLTDSKILRAIETISLTNVFGLDKETQKSYLKIIHYLCKQKIDLCNELTQLAWKTYLLEFNQSNCVEQALSHVALFLTGAHKMYPVTKNDWQASCAITLFALKQFNNITEQQQLQFVHTYSISTLPPLVYQTSSEDLERYKEIQNIFKGFSPFLFQKNLYLQNKINTAKSHLTTNPEGAKASRATIPTTVEIEEGDTVVVSNRDLYTVFEATSIQTKAYSDLVTKSEFENQKLAQLSQFFSDFIIHYTSFVAVKDRAFFESKCRDLLPSFTKQLQLGEPNMVSASEFRLLGSLLTQFSHFVLSINNGDFELDKIEIVDVQSKFQISLEMLFTKMSHYIQKEGLLNEAFAPWFCSILVEAAVSSAIKPYHLYLILEHLIEDPFDIVHSVNSKIPLEAFPCDQDVSETLGTALSNVVKELIKMGSKNNLSFIEKEIISLVEGKKKLIADYIQKSFHQFKNGPNTLLSFSIIHHILFKKVNGTIVPLFDGSRKEPSDEELQANLKKLESKICLKFINMIQREVKTSLLAKWVTNSNTFQEYFNSLFSQLWKIGTNQSAMKTLLTLLVEGFFPGLSEIQLSHMKNKPY